MTEPRDPQPLSAEEIDWFRPRHYNGPEDGEGCHWCNEMWPCPTARWLATIDVIEEKASRDAERDLGERDSAEDWADRLAYAIAPVSVLGEHSNLNNPWQNALDFLDAARSTDGLRAALQRIMSLPLHTFHGGPDGTPYVAAEDVLNAFCTCILPWLEPEGEHAPYCARAALADSPAHASVAAPPAPPRIDPERLARAIHATGLNTIGRKPGSHGKFTKACICNGDAAAIAAAYAEGADE